MTSPAILMKAWKLYPKKQLGQNFLADANMAEAIVGFFREPGNQEILDALLDGRVKVGEAITVGDLEDAESDVRALLGEHYSIRRKQALGTEPSVYYIV